MSMSAGLLVAVAEPTWGITGPRFLLIYVVLVVVALLAANAVRWWARSTGPVSSVDGTAPVGLDPIELAHLHDGPRRTTLVTLTVLERRGQVEIERGSGDVWVTAVDDGRRPADLHPAERAVLDV